ncbi:MAG: ATP-binding cassette domain-containing protein, partial [Candidatus Promineifilaceae bacterium]
MRVELRHISKSFGPLRANDAISLTFEPGRIYGLLGENGAGKSTLMKILSGFQRPDGGQIVLDGRPLAFAAPAEALAAGVGMLYQDPLDLPPFRVIDNYLLGWPSGLRLDYAAAATELRALAGRYHFTLDLQAPVDSLSLGERQQLELMRLLAGGAKVLILDEPTTGISAEQKDTLFASMRRLAFDEGKTLILVSHKLAEVQELCQHAFVLRRGRLAGETSLPAPTERLVGLMFGQAPARQRRPALPPGAPVLDVDKVSLSDGRLACEDINLSLHSGEVFGLAGLEGSGQRLLLRACAGLLAPRRGRIRLRGQDV